MFAYRNASNKRPGVYSIFELLGGGGRAYSTEALIFLHPQQFDFWFLKPILLKDNK